MPPHSFAHSNAPTRGLPFSRIPCSWHMEFVHSPGSWHFTRRGFSGKCVNEDLASFLHPRSLSNGVGIDNCRFFVCDRNRISSLLVVTKPRRKCSTLALDVAGGSEDACSRRSYLKQIPITASYRSLLSYGRGGCSFSTSNPSQFRPRSPKVCPWDWGQERGGQYQAWTRDGRFGTSAATGSAEGRCRGVMVHCSIHVGENDRGRIVAGRGAGFGWLGTHGLEENEGRIVRSATSSDAHGVFVGKEHMFDSTDDVVARRPRERVAGSKEGVIDKEEAEDKKEEVEVVAERDCDRDDVSCEVTTVSWRERKIRATISVNASAKVLWQILTDYERLAEFIPNLVQSERIPCPHAGRTWISQLGVQTSMYWQIEARAILDLEERPDAADGPELLFSMVKGDFDRFDGKWSLLPPCSNSESKTLLVYEVNVIPMLLLPTIFVERIIRADLPKNLRAIAHRAEKLAAHQDFLANSEVEEERELPLQNRKESDKLKIQEVKQSATAAGTQLASTYTSLKQPPLSPGREKVMEQMMESRISSPSNLLKSVQTQKAGVWPPSKGGVLQDFDLGLHVDGRGGVLGLREDISAKKGELDQAYLDSRRERDEKGAVCDISGGCQVDEIHLRRLDDLLENGGVHRRVIAALTIQAPMQEIWRVLTDYERLPDFIPNLASSEVVASKRRHGVRLIQIGFKCLMYMVLHARVVLDVVEKPLREIVFRLVEGDFDSFQGKWSLEPLSKDRTLLRYIVDTHICQNSMLPEALVEEVIYEDLPANLCAFRNRIEELSSRRKQLESEEGLAGGSERQMVRKGEGGRRKRSENPSKQRVRKKDMYRDFSGVERELRNFIAEFGISGVMPMRTELRARKRVDLEKAVSKEGGFVRVATRLGLKLAYRQRKPKGYWHNLENLQKEIADFQKQQGKDMMIMPTRRSMEVAGRFDLARSLEKWGGLLEVARALDLKVTHRQKATHKVFVARGGNDDQACESNEEAFDLLAGSGLNANLVEAVVGEIDSAGGSLAVDGAEVGPMKALVPKRSKWIKLTTEWMDRS